MRSPGDATVAIAGSLSAASAPRSRRATSWSCTPWGPWPVRTSVPFTASAVVLRDARSNGVDGGVSALSSGMRKTSVPVATHAPPRVTESAVIVDGRVI
jgi:hypothetical protein